MKKIRIKYEYWQGGARDLQMLINEKLKAEGLQIMLEQIVEKQDKKFTYKVEDNVSINYEGRRDCRSVRGDAALLTY